MNLEEGKIYFEAKLLQLELDKSSYQTWGDVYILEGSIRLNETIILRVKNQGTSRIFQEIPISHDKSLHAAIYRSRNNINAILITKQTNASRVKEDIPPILDDQAQLLGPSLRYVVLRNNIDQFSNQIMKGLRRRFATILSNEQCICIGEKMDDAYVAAQLVEKTAKAFIEAKKLGGAKSINRIEAWLMHQFYMLKYSREQEKNK